LAPCGGSRADWRVGGPGGGGGVPSCSSCGAAAGAVAGCVGSAGGCGSGDPGRGGGGLPKGAWAGLDCCRAVSGHRAVVGGRNSERSSRSAPEALESRSAVVFGVRSCWRWGKDSWCVVGGVVRGFSYRANRMHRHHEAQAAVSHRLSCSTRSHTTSHCALI